MSSCTALLGNGDGSFQPFVPYVTNAGPQSIKASDLNGDGKLDFIVADSVSQDLSVLLGNGDGTFQPQVFFAVSHGTGSLAVGTSTAMVFLTSARRTGATTWDPG
jgi:hypothetical protein